MNIKIVNNHLSVKGGSSYEFKNFTVITGENGSGKTNLLRSLCVKDNAFVDDVLNTNLYIKYFSHDFFERTRVEDDYAHGSIMESHLDTIWKEFRSSDSTNVNFEKQIKEIAEANGKKVEELTSEDFKNMPINRSSEKIELFDFTYFMDTAIYLRYLEKNDYNEFIKSKYNLDNLVYTNEEFVKRFGIPPWIRINNIFQEIGLEYQINPPDLTKRIHRISSQLIDKVTGKIIDVKALSNGERTILSIAAFLYNAEHVAKIPDVFLFDEPDALLHPDFSKKIISILNGYIVGKLKKKVIMTTHSPSTVAIVPEDSIFISEKGSFIPKPATKDKALNKLTQNINSLSILHENRKQIFVEDKDDVLILEALKNKVRDHLHPEISLHFIAVSLGGKSGGGCDNVKLAAKTLYECGNKNISGIIDWDLKNKSTNYINVLGENIRYNIESYLLDPILLYGFLLATKVTPPKNVNISLTYQFSKLSELENKELQKISDQITSLAIDLKPANSTNEVRLVKYLNGKEVNIPTWFLEFDGHCLEKHFEAIFKPLKGLIINNRKSLGLMILQIVISEFPGYIPIEIVELFRKIQMD